MTSFKQLVQQMSRATGLSTGVINAQVMAESGYNPNAVSPAGAEGWLQFEPGTYNSYAAQAGVAPGTEFNPADEAKVYDVFMGQLLREFGGNVQKALAAYNAGPGNIAAGMGYANGILAQAGESTSYAANAAIAAATGRPSLIPAKTVAPAKAAVRHVSTSTPIPAARVTNPHVSAASGVNTLSAPGRPGTAANTASTAAAAQAAHAAHVAHVAHEAHIASHPAVKTATATAAKTATTNRGTVGTTRIVNR